MTATFAGLQPAPEARTNAEFAAFLLRISRLAQPSRAQVGIFAPSYKRAIWAVVFGVASHSLVEFRVVPLRRLICRERSIVRGRLLLGALHSEHLTTARARHSRAHGSARYSSAFNGDAVYADCRSSTLLRREASQTA